MDPLLKLARIKRGKSSTKSNRGSRVAIIALEEKRPAILVVDDEPRILSALQRLLREEPYRLFCCGKRRGSAWTISS